MNTVLVGHRNDIGANWTAEVAHASPSVSALWSPAFRSLFSGVKEIERKSSRGLFVMGMMSVAIAAAMLTFIVCLPGREALDSVIGSTVRDSSLAFLDGSKLKRSYLERMSAEYRKAMGSHTQYVYEVIRATRRDSVGIDRKLAALIVTHSMVEKYDPLLVASVIMAESTFRNHSVSFKGAQGLMQLMPNTAKYISNIAKLEWKGAGSLSDPDYNLRLGIAYLKYLQDSFRGNLEHALIAYNWGPSNMNKALLGRANIPQSSRQYARKIIKTHRKWKTDFDTRIAQLTDIHMNAMIS